MALNSRKVRLPELPIFRKFSLALRQEFARAEEVLQALEESRQQIKALIEEGGLPLRPGPRPSGRAELPPAGRGRSGESDIEDDSPKSFLKDSVADSSSAAAGKAGGPPSTGATAAVKPPGREQEAGQRGRSSAAEKKRPASKRISKRAATDSRPAGNEAGSTISAEREVNGPSRSRKKDDSTQPKPSPASRKESKSQSGEVPAVQAPSGASPTDDEEREFWGDERWRKGRKGRGDKGRSGRLDIVRVGAEGRPVGDAKPPAHEGK